MVEILLSPDFLLLIALADFRLWLMFFGLLIFHMLRSHQFSPDKNFQRLVYRIGLAYLLCFFTINVFIAELAATGEYRPLLIGHELYDQINPDRREQPADGQTKAHALSGPTRDAQIQNGGTPIDNREIQRLLFKNLGENLWRFFLVNLFIVVLGIYVFYRPSPKWIPTLGIDVIDREVPNLVDATIWRVVRTNLFVYLVLLVMTIGAYDLVHLANVAPPIGSTEQIRSHLAQSDVDRRFFVSIIIAPALFAWAVGTAAALRYRMLYGDLQGYRQRELTRLASRFRRWSRRRRPRIDRRPPEQPESEPPGASAS